MFHCTPAIRGAGGDWLVVDIVAAWSFVPLHGTLVAVRFGVADFSSFLLPTVNTLHFGAWAQMCRVGAV